MKLTNEQALQNLYIAARMAALTAQGHEAVLESFKAIAAALNIELTPAPAAAPATE